ALAGQIIEATNENTAVREIAANVAEAVKAKNAELARELEALNAARARRKSSEKRVHKKREQIRLERERREREQRDRDRRRGPCWKMFDEEVSAWSTSGEFKMSAIANSPEHWECGPHDIGRGRCF